ncbi:hypothetical protein PX699_00275 [Sphingobium sp. H39-3-25]|uniref:hypothetical protein n=1 Tax=Sphingobium arseniciresistens TaxID=3030834 RepID=UPI0023B8F5F7|nr:hypothetical protein [Sphingobium arseniciresistens]
MTVIAIIATIIFMSWRHHHQSDRAQQNRFERARAPMLELENDVREIRCDAA